MTANQQISKACGRCRTRRMKCNKQRPECGQCQSAKVPCPGYHHVDSFSPFINETYSVMRKCAKSRSRLPALTTDSQPSGSETGSEVMLHPMDLTLQPPMVDVARHFFLGRLLDDSQFYYVADMCTDRPRQDNENSLFDQAVESLALASFSNDKNDPAVLHRAYASYAQSLSKLRSSLQDESSEKVLASVLLLSQFESLLPCSDESTIHRCWSQHTLGAYAILRQHKEKLDFTSSLERWLAIQTLHALNLLYVDMAKDKPQHVLDMTSKLLQDCDDNEHRDKLRLRLHASTDSVNELHQMMKSQPEVDPVLGLQKTLRVERAVVAIQADIGSVVAFKTFTKEDLNCRRGFEHAALYRGGYHVYRTMHDLRLWNNVRMLRLTILEIRHSLLERLQKSRSCEEFCHRANTNQSPDLGVRGTDRSPFQQIWSDTRSTIIELVDEVCASAVQPLRPGSSDCTTAAASQLVWPLYICARMAPDRCLDYVKGRLEWIGQSLKVHSATLAVSKLTTPVYQDDYLHVCHTF